MTFRVAYVPGGYDLFHIGHLNILQAARSVADSVVAGVVTDEVLAEMKGRRPVIPFPERIAIVAAIRDVDRVVADHSSSKLEAWKAVRFDAIVKGDDWKGTAKGRALEAEMRTVGAEVVYFPYTTIRSTTSTRRGVVRHVDLGGSTVDVIPRSEIA